MLKLNRSLLILTSTFYFFTSLPVFAQESTPSPLTRNPIGIPVEVTAGQEFYAQTPTEYVPAYKLEHPFKSSMPGAMGLPFGFAIDSDVLVRTGKTSSGWEYFVPPDNKFRAYHALLGSVIRNGDTVGLRVGSRGQMEWFVDNSNYNKMSTIWTRPIRPNDPIVTRFNLSVKAPTGESVEKLIYLGLTDTNHVRIRLERISGSGTVRDEFIFPLDKDGNGQGAVAGCEFKIQASSMRAVVTVTKAMTSDIGNPQ